MSDDIVQSPDIPAAAAPAAAPRGKLERSGGRLVLIMLGFVGIYGAIIATLVSMAVAPDPKYLERHNAQAEIATARPDILDRNGILVATDVKVPSVYAEPRNIIDADEAAEALAAALPGIDVRDLRARLSTDKGFIWVKREITPKEHDAVLALGLPGVGFLMENKRIYPNGPTLSHVLGSVNIDNQGIAGIEQYLDRRGLGDLHALGFAAAPDELEPVNLSIDLKAQHVLRDELTAGMERYKAKAAAGAVMDVTTGEMIALVSLPDFDPNDAAQALDPNRINRINVGVFEMGSTFKALTLAMALDSGRFNTDSMLDARRPLHYGRFAIDDYHPQRRILSLPEVFTYSSNIGSARMALALGVDEHKAFLRKMGQLDRLVTELPENAQPIVPPRWGELNTVTIAFGHGLSVAPLQAVMAVAAMMNGGHLVKPTFLKSADGAMPADAPQVIDPHTSDVMRYLMRLNAEVGTAKKADVPGLLVGGKTGTAEKVVGGRYSKTKLFTTFMAVFPFDKPKYLVLTLYDEPQPTKETFGFATAGWNAAPTTSKIIERLALALDIAPRREIPPNPVPPLAPGPDAALAPPQRVLAQTEP